MKVLPCPGRLSSKISPPSRRASSRLMVSPSPVPPKVRLVDESACWKASKMSSCFSAGMPIPVSETAIASTCPAERRPGAPKRGPPRSQRIANSTCPRAVNLNALESRFLSTC